MTRTTQEAQAQEMRGVLAVVVMLLLAGVFTILFAAGHLSDNSQSPSEVETHSAVVSKDK
jgi:hypothetical protein